MWLFSNPVTIPHPSSITCTDIVTDNVDSSGIRFTLTRVPREFNAGISGVGSEVNSNLFVPPNTDEFNVYGYCTSGCTRQVKYII